jgi:putative sigma-54 modulation protein
MKLQLISQGFALTPALRRHLERRLAFALGRFGHEVSQVWARVADTNGPKGGVDKLVAVRVQGRRLQTILVSDTDANLYAAIDRAADRVGRAIARALDRHQQRRYLRPD